MAAPEITADFTRQDAPVGARRGRRGGGPDLSRGGRAARIALGASAVSYAASRRDGWSAPAAAAGLALLAVGVSGRAPLARALGASEEEREEAAQRGWPSATIHSRAVTIGKPRADVYRFFRDFANLPRFMENIDRIDVLDETRSRWTVRAPRGRVSWEARITHDDPEHAISWESAPGADIPNAGVVEFRDAPGGRGTEVHATIAYSPPRGAVGRIAAKLSQREPGIQARRDLKRMKMLLETGEIATNAPFGGSVPA